MRRLNNAIYQRRNRCDDSEGSGSNAEQLKSCLKRNYGQHTAAQAAQRAPVCHYAARDSKLNYLRLRRNDIGHLNVPAKGECRHAPSVDEVVSRDDYLDRGRYRTLLRCLNQTCLRAWERLLASLGTFSGPGDQTVP